MKIFASIAAFFLSAVTLFGEQAQWNVLFDDWHILGPFPQVDDGTFGLNTDYFEWTGEPPDFQQPVTWEGTTFQWRPLKSNTAYTQETAIRTPGVFYAMTIVQVEKEQDAILAFGAHQSVAVWHGAEKIFQIETRNRSRMDNFKIKVHLAAGPNCFLFKTHSDIGAQRVLARLIPSDVPKPLVALRYTGVAVDTRPQAFPDIVITMLDGNDRPISEHRCSGNVSIASELPLYPLYAASPEKTPAAIKVQFADEEAKKLGSVRIPWKKVAAEMVDFDLAVPQQFHLVLDGLPQDEAPQLTLYSGEKAVPFTLNESGNGIDFTVPSAPIVYREFVVGGVGLQSQAIQLTPHDPLVVHLQTGCALSGRITKPDGSPVAGAYLRAMFNRKFVESDAKTGDDGAFELPGLPSNSNVQLLVAPPGNTPGFTLQVNTQQGPVQKLEEDLTAEPAARIRGKVRQPTEDFRYTRILLTGPRGMLLEPVNSDGSFDIVIPPDNYMSILAKSADLAPQRRLIDLAVAPSLEFDFDLKPSAPAFLQFLGQKEELLTAVNLNFNSRDGAFPLNWFCLANGQLVVVSPPLFPVVVIGSCNTSGRMSQFTGVMEGPGEYNFEETNNGAPMGGKRRVVR